MAIYIKNMKMPKQCIDCPCYYSIRGDEYLNGRDGCGVLGIQFNEYIFEGMHIHNPFEEVYKDCPLVEVGEDGEA